MGLSKTYFIKVIISNNRESPQFTSGENRPIFLKLTYPFPNLLLKMIFPFQRWDMLVPWRVYTATIIIKHLLSWSMYVLGGQVFSCWDICSHKNTHGFAKKSLEIVKSIRIPNGGSVMNDLPGCTVNKHLQQIHVKWVTDIHGSHHYVKHGLKKNYNSKTYFGITSQETIFRTMIHNRRHSTTKKKHTHTIHAWYINLHLAVCLW